MGLRRVLVPELYREDSVLPRPRFQVGRYHTMADEDQPALRAACRLSCRTELVEGYTRELPGVSALPWLQGARDVL